MARDLSREDKFKFAEALYKGNRAHVEAVNKNRAKKGKELIPFTSDTVYANLFENSTVKGESFELVEECLNILIRHKGLTDRRDIEDYITGLYDEKGNNYIKDCFFANYDIKEEDWHTDIRFMDATPYKGQVDLYVGGSPCCSYSRSGKRLCLEDTRGDLFYDFALRIKECEPKVFIFENVKDMIRANNPDEMSGFEVALTVFDELGYKLYWHVLDGADYGMPQHRERVWCVGIRNDLDKNDFLFPHPIKLNSRMYDYLDDDILPKSGMVDKPFERELTGTEYLRLMGFRNFNVPDSIKALGKKKEDYWLSFMAGNSMVVECLMALYLQLDITKYGENLGDELLKPSLYDYTSEELDDLITRARAIMEAKHVDLSYLTTPTHTYSDAEIVKVGAIKAPKSGKGDSQWDRRYSVRGICPTQTKVGKIHIIVTNEMRNCESSRPQCIEPTKRIPNPLW